MSWSQIASYIAAAALLAWSFSPGLKSLASSVKSRVVSLFSGSTAVVSAAGSAITVEQAQAATLLLTRFKSQNPKPSELPLIDAEIKTLVG